MESVMTDLVQFPWRTKSYEVEQVTDGPPTGDAHPLFNRWWQDLALSEHEPTLWKGKDLTYGNTAKLD